MLSRLVRPAAALLLAAAAACGGSADAEEAPGGGAEKGGAPRVRTLTLGAYTTPREVYGERIIPAFQRHWMERTGEDVRVQESYLGSGAQARAIKEGFEADVAALSLEPDIQVLVDAGLVRPEWKNGPSGGMVTRSIVVIGVRPGNPKGIREWSDLAKPGVEVLTPNPRTSGGAMWNVAALYGAALRGNAPGAGNGAQGAEALVAGVLPRVRVMDKGARESMLTFESGVGDAIITYENEALVARKAGKEMDYVIPRSTIRIENPVAVVHEYAEKHGNLDVAQGFVDFLATPEVQRMFAEYGLRPVDRTVEGEVAARFPAVADLFTIADLGGWPQVTQTLFAQGAVFDRASARLAR